MARDMSEAENPVRRAPEHIVSVEDVRQLMGASTPHFALQIRGRIARLIRGLPANDPARVLGEREIARLTALGHTGEVRGTPHEPEIRPLTSVDDLAAAEAAAHAGPAH
ncbi:MAG: hypothetical protein JWM31_847 [Solirubrobacterales bacterium]|nr:hypothetical protein [Solirubrobacterales bacterium]